MLKKILWAVFFVSAAFLLYGTGKQYFTAKRVADVPGGYVMGNADGDVSVVAFFDYRCIYCKQAHPTLMEAAARDGDVRVIIRPVVMVEPQSIYAARAVYAAALQGDAFFAALHARLIEEEGDITPERVRLHAQTLGLDWDRLQQDLESQAVEDSIIDNHRIFAAIGTKATPTFVIGEKMRYVPEGRMPGVADFMAMFEDARLKGL